MNIYLAGASAELETCEYWMAQLRGQGHIITHDWTVSVRANKYLQISDSALSREARAGYARADLCGISNADIFWLLAPSTHSTGAWVELGYAIASAELRNGEYWIDDPHRVVVSGPHHHCIFAALADVMCESHEEAFIWICTSPTSGAMSDLDKSQ